MRIDNQTKYLSADLKALIVAGLAATNTRKPLLVRIRYSRNHGKPGEGWHGGWARYDGRGMQLTLPGNPELVSPILFARTIVHEAAHLRGLRHSDMRPETLHPDSHQLPVPWAEGLQIRLKPVKVAPVIDLATARAQRAKSREEKIRAKLAKVEQKLARLEKRRKSLQRSLDYYDRKSAAADKPGDR